jgi:hypothetical protein
MQERQLGESEKLVSAGTPAGDSSVQLGQRSFRIRLEALRQVPSVENIAAGATFLSDSQHVGGELAMNNAGIDPLDSDRYRTSAQQERQ